MSITTYIQELQERKEISYMQLAKEIGITYPSMMSLKNGLVSSISNNLLTKLAEYEGRKKEDILYDIFIADLNENIDVTSLKYICKKNIEGYMTNYPYSILNPYIQGYIIFDGVYSKKRIGNNYTLVQSWENLCKEHWQQFGIHRTVEWSRDDYIKLFRNEEIYISNVIAYAIQRIQINKNDVIKGYDILFRTDQQFDYKLATKFMVYPKYLKVNLILTDN